MNAPAIKELILKMADDALIIGHRNSEWNGFAPIIEEDIAFASIAQDKIGHAWALYKILHEHFGETDPDRMAFFREEKDFRCCHFVELPIGEYDFSLVRHFLFDHAEYCRYEMLEHSSYEPLAQLAKKIKGEIKYHLLHADTWIKKLGAQGSEESHARMQSSLNELYPLALGIFEPGNFENELMGENIFAGETELQKQWLENITNSLNNTNLKLPEVKNPRIGFGGRKGFHTEYLRPLITEMSEVIKSEEAGTEW